MSEQPTVQELYEMGKKYAATGTIAHDLIIRHGACSSVLGVLAKNDYENSFIDFSSQVGCNTF